MPLITPIESQGGFFFLLENTIIMYNTIKITPISAPTALAVITSTLEPPLTGDLCLAELLSGMGAELVLKTAAELALEMP